MINRRDALKTIAGTALAAALPLPAMAAKTPTIMVQHPAGCPCPACYPENVLHIKVWCEGAVPEGGGIVPYVKWSDTYDNVRQALRDVNQQFPDAFHIEVETPRGHRLCCEKWKTGWFFESYTPDGKLDLSHRPFKKNSVLT